MSKYIKSYLPYIMVVIVIAVVIVLYLDYESDDLMNRMDDAMNNSITTETIIGDGD